MQILNIGPLELLVVLLFMFLLLGPKESILMAQRIGQWIRGFVRSPMWREIIGYSQEIRELPQKIMDDTGLKETLDEIKTTTAQTTQELNSTVQDAVRDARVPEAENIRIETNPTSVPTAPSKPVVNPAEGEQAQVVDAAGAGDADPEPARDAAETPATAPEEAPKPRRGRPRKTEPVTAETTEIESQPAAPRTRRSRKTIVADQPSQEIIPAEQASSMTVVETGDLVTTPVVNASTAEQTPAVLAIEPALAAAGLEVQTPRRTRKPKKTIDSSERTPEELAADEPVDNTGQIAVNAPVLSEPPVTRKPRRPRKDVVSTVQEISDEPISPE